MKKYLSVIPLVFLLCFVVGCQDKAAMAELEEFKAQAGLEETNHALMVRGQEAWANGDIETLREIISPDFVWHSADGQDLSLEETFESIKQTRMMFPDAEFNYEGSFVKGNTAASMSVFKGTHTGDVEGFPATGKAVEVMSISIVRAENGKVVEMWTVENELNFYRQLGFELKPPEEKK